MSALTQHAEPHPRYQAKSGHAPLGGWHRDADGNWRRVYVRRGARLAKRATVMLRDGLWFWEVEAFDAARRVRRITARCAERFGRLFAHDQFGFADLAARTRE